MTNGQKDGKSAVKALKMEAKAAATAKSWIHINGAFFLATDVRSTEVGSPPHQIPEKKVLKGVRFSQKMKYLTLKPTQLRRRHIQIAKNFVKETQQKAGPLSRLYLSRLGATCDQTNAHLISEIFLHLSDTDSAKTPGWQS